MEISSAEKDFKPQRKHVYNRLLPYSSDLHSEALSQLAEIKAGIGKAVHLRDIKIGASHWTGQLSKYIRFYSHYYTKEDHLIFIKLTFELVTIPDLELSLVAKFANLLISLLRKIDLLSRDDLTIPWRPLAKLVDNVLYNKNEHVGLQLIPNNMEGVIKSLVRVSRPYFSVESTQEMLDEWRPLLCPFDTTMIQGVTMLELFLPTHLPPEHHDKGFKLWLDEFLELWIQSHIQPSYEEYLIQLFTRVALNNIGYIDWEPYIPQLFTRLMRSFGLPVGTNQVQVTRNGNKNYDVGTCSSWIVAMMGGGSSAQQHITMMMKALESFFHPSNAGKWSGTIMKLTLKLSTMMVKRLHWERFKKTWIHPVPASYKLKDEEVTDFVKSLNHVVFLSMFSKRGSSEAAMTLERLAVLRPELIIPPLLERTFPALETLTEPHRLIACLNCTVTVSRSMLVSHQAYPEGRLQVLPLLNLCLPGIDPNDLRKCLTTFQLIATLASLVPLVDCSPALGEVPNMTEVESELCSASALFEDFVLRFLDKVFSLIENTSNEFTRTDSTSNNKLNSEESVLEMALLSTFSAIMHQSSDSIYNEAIKKLFRFVSTSCFEIRIAGRYTADLLRAAVKAHPTRALKMFMPHLCSNLTERLKNEDLSQEEHLDNQFLWNLKLLSETVRCNGLHILPYQDSLLSVLRSTLYLKCKEASDIAGNLLRHLLKVLTLIYTTDYKSSEKGWNQPFNEHLPIRDWGCPGDVNNLDVHWHLPSPEELEFATEILKEFLLPQLSKIQNHISGNQSLSRDELKLILGIILHCVVGAGGLLPIWDGEPVKLVESLVPLKRFNFKAKMNNDELTLENQNIRVLIIDTLRPLLEFMLANGEDDTKSLLQVIRIYSVLVLYMGTHKDELDGRWKSLQMVKKSMDNKLLGKKRHIRAVLIDRLQLQHELRVVNSSAKNLTSKHSELFNDLFRLSVSRYSEVRKMAQHVLGHCFHMFAYSYRILLDRTIDCLKNDEAIEHHQFKGALFIVHGDGKRSLMIKRSWEVMLKMWPAILKAQHSEKPSILILLEAISHSFLKNIEQTELEIKVPDSLLAEADKIWLSSSHPTPACGLADADEKDTGLWEEYERNALWKKSYFQLVDILMDFLETKTARWRFQQFGMDILSVLIRHDVRIPARVVEFYTKNLIDETIQVRKISLRAMIAILKQQKRPHAKQQINPYELASVPEPDAIMPGDRKDNKWHVYDSSKEIDSLSKWNKTTFVEKTHWGYYTWPKELTVYAPMNKQPPLGRSLEKLSVEERPIYEHFSDEEFVRKLISFLSLEENKGKDRFHAQHFGLFKGLFRNFDDTFLDLFRVELEKLLKDKGHRTQENSHRCAAEIIAALLRGSKHWGYVKTVEMWEWLDPLLKVCLNEMTVDSISDWGTCFATASESRDPRKLSPLLEILMDSPLRGNGGSFGDSSRLYVLQGALGQQEWRVSELLHRLLKYIWPNLNHVYKNVRDRLGSVLVNISMYDMNWPRGNACSSPRMADILEKVVKELEILKTPLASQESNHAESDTVKSEKGHFQLKQSSNPGMEESSCEEPMEVQGVVESKSRKSQRSLKSERSLHSPVNFSGLPKSIEKMDVDVNQAKKSSDVSDVDVSDSKKTPEELQHENAIRICKTVMKWIQGCYGRMIYCSRKEMLPLIPVFCMLESDVKDPELRRDAFISLACIAQGLVTPQMVDPLIDILKEVSVSPSWHAREAILGYIQVCVFCNLFTLKEERLVTAIRDVVLQLICDEQVEVREMAAITLAGYFQCGFLPIDQYILDHFKKLRRTNLKSKRKDVDASVLLAKRHAGVLGLSACIQAFPYDVPQIIPDILMDLSSHLEDAQPITLTVKKTLSNFKRTHYDNWQDHKQQFTDDQLVVLTDLLVSPNYYA